MRAAPRPPADIPGTNDPLEGPALNGTIGQLREGTIILADTGGASRFRRHRSRDFIADPSPALAALRSGNAAPLVDAQVNAAGNGAPDAAALCDTLTVALGAQLAELVPE